jgi:hypothetical protein
MRTTVALRPETRDRLLELKRAWRTRSVDEVIDRLVGGAPLGAKALYESKRKEIDAVLAGASVEDGAIRAR